MKKIHRVLALLMAALMAIGLMTTAFAEPTIDPSKKAAFSIYKYDITRASNDGAWDTESYVSTGLHDDAVVDKLEKYAIQGVEFTYLRMADIAMNNELVDGQRTVGVLYGFDGSDRSNAVLSAIGLTAADAHKTEGGINYFTSDALNSKLAAALAANATTVKNALEAAVRNGGVAMTETDITGHTSAGQLEQGLYLIVETRVPENVTSTCNPFFVSLPMTTIDGAEWNYDVTVYPKNQTGNPDLEKTVREAENSTGKNNGSLTDIKDGYGGTYAHKEIAFEFASWISVEFKLYLVKEFERLKTEEMKQLGWDIKRNLAKINYRIHTDAIKENLIPPELSARQISLVYANEADVLNMALFGMTAKQWRDSHPDLKGNIRDYANVSQLVCLSNLENLNAVFINEGISQSERLAKLNAVAISQMKVLTEDHRLLQLEAADDTEKPQ